MDEKIELDHPKWYSAQPNPDQKRGSRWQSAAVLLLAGAFALASMIAFLAQHNSPAAAAISAVAASGCFLVAGLKIGTRQTRGEAITQDRNRRRRMTVSDVAPGYGDRVKPERDEDLKR